MAAGERPWPHPHTRPRGRRRSRPPHGCRCALPRHRHAHPVRLLVGQLEAPEAGGQRHDAADRALRGARDSQPFIAAGIRLTVIGRRDRLPASVVAAIEKVEHDTASGTRLNVRIAIDYSAVRPSLMQRAAAPATASLTTLPSRIIWPPAPVTRMLTWSSAPPANSACPASCRGRQPMPSCTFARNCGQTSPVKTSPPPYTTSRPATGASAGWTSRANPCQCGGHAKCAGILAGKRFLPVCNRAPNAFD
jgi:hypothetical protein